jgi:hypothetical protein
MGACRRCDIQAATAVFCVEFIDRFFTSFTHDKRLSLLDPYNGNEKQIKIMIHPFVIGLMKTAHRASPGGIVEYFHFRRNAANQKHSHLAGYKLS